MIYVQICHEHILGQMIKIQSVFTTKKSHSCPRRVSGS